MIGTPSQYVLWYECFTLFHNGTNHEMEKTRMDGEIRGLGLARRKTFFKASPSKTPESTPFQNKCNLRSSMKFI